MMPHYICYVAGKSGGHIIPAMTHAQAELNKNPESSILFFSTNSPLDRSIIKEFSFISFHKPLHLGNIPRKKLWLWPRFLLQLSIVLMQSAYSLIRYRPKKVVSTGGYISLPVCFVAWVLRIPVEVYELNVIPGAAAKVLSYIAQKTHCCFEKTVHFMPQKAACKVSPYPVRYNDSDKLSKQEACKLLGIVSDKRVILILGGSQGSRFVNDVVKKGVFCSKNKDKLHIIHQTGKNDVSSVKQCYQELGISSDVFAYRHDLSLYYSAADKIIARAGAGTLFEIAFFKKPAFIIPLEAATTGHQVDNAHAMVEQYPHYFTVARQSQSVDLTQIFN